MDIEKLYELFLTHPLVSTDSRMVQPGSIYFSLKGEKFDGNLYASSAIDAGASYAVIDNKKFQKDDRFIFVKDSLVCLQQLAAFHRQKLSILVIAVTGSNGKTTTKELLRNVLSQHFIVQATSGNLNNHIGVPLTLLELKKETQVSIVEMGANHLGEIKTLCEIAMPDSGIITNVGRAHLEGFGGFEGVQRAKGELYDYLSSKNGTVFINAENNHLMKMIKPESKLVKYGTHGAIACTGQITASNPYLSIRCRLKEGKEININSKLFGDYNFENILAAVCIGNYYGVSPVEIQYGIESYIPALNRSQVIQKGTNTLFMDAYNANPTSMENAILNFINLKADKKIMILGDMMELGSDTEKEHQEIVALIKRNKFYDVILVGEYFKKYTQENGIRYFGDAESAGKWIESQNISGTSFLIKGSRKMKLEVIADMIS